MKISAERVQMLAEAIRERGDEEAAVMVEELLRFTSMEKEHGIELPKDKNTHRKNSCIGKLRLDEAEAIQQAFKSNRGFVSWMREVVAYPCLYCGHWHIGKDNPENEKYGTGEPMTSMEQLYRRVWLGVQMPWWLAKRERDYSSSMGSMMTLLFEGYGWELPEKPGRLAKMAARFKAEFIDGPKGGEGDEVGG